jgi:hypothetical protein
MGKTDCPHMSSCEMFGLLKLSGSLELWKGRYCSAEYQQCARYKMSLEGRQVPINLMPNGVYLRAHNKTPG